MASYKVGRLSEDMKRELSALLRELKDPRISQMLSIVRCEVSSDCSHCKVHVSALEGEEATLESVKGLKSAAGYMRRELGKALELRHVPELRFLADNSIAYSVKIAQTLSELERKEGKPEHE